MAILGFNLVGSLIYTYYEYDIAPEFIVRVWLCWPSSHCVAWHVLAPWSGGIPPRKSLKIYTPDIEPGSSFDGNYETVKLMVGS